MTAPASINASWICLCGAGAMAAVGLVGTARDCCGLGGFGLKERSLSWFNAPVAVMDPNDGSESAWRR